jgi:hypothetical protein
MGLSVNAQERLKEIEEEFEERKQELQTDDDELYPPLLKKAIKKLEEVIKVIKKDPRKLDMKDWGRVYSKEAKDSEGNILYTPKAAKKDFNSCGTVGCIAGWVCLLGDPKLKQSLVNNAKEMSVNSGSLEFCSLDYDVDPSELAEEMLGISGAQADLLFLPFTTSYKEDHWPVEFVKAYNKAKTPEERVVVTVKRIRHFIKTNGKE